MMSKTKTKSEKVRLEWKHKSSC